MLCRTSTFVLAAAVLACVVNSVQAVIIDPVSATASTAYPSRGANNTINGSGLTGGPPVTAESQSVDPTTMWLNNSNALDAHPSITWDLGALYALTGFHLWNYNEAGTESDRGFAVADVQVSRNGVTYTDLGNMPLTQAPGSTPYTGLDYLLHTGAVRYVTFTSIHNFGGANSDYTGLSEIRFYGAAVPEPSSLILCGLGAIGLFIAARRRRKA